MKIKGFIETSLSDYDGKVSSVIFLPGCNFRCKYCFNTEIVLRPEQMPTIPLEKIKKYIKENRAFIDAVVITGGEPCMHQELPELARELKKLNLLVKLDTNGSSPEMLKKMIAEKLIDYVAMDVKAPFEKYEKVTGTKTNTNNVKESIKTIINSGIEHEFRTTAVPGLVSREDLTEMAKNIKGARRFVIQQFSPQLGKLMDKKLEKQKPYSREEMRETAKECCKHVKTDAR